ncbi:iron uptake protein [Oleiphilus messinensis]|uniref:Iron uptake protein n=1 Tax=Oleiphilus messinensis TaxID=141451 RepID=A0A1Y0II03_9GAMM|nr:iron uptake protein [Oleiphilus messinensis]ARU59486.1 iron uptake protein [Oleiphilus messinensis]
MNLRNAKFNQNQIMMVLSRIATALLGSYAFTWGITSLGIAGLVALDVEFHVAEEAMLLIAFLLFLVLFLWAFAAPRLAWVWAVLGGGALLTTTAAWLLQHMILN